MILSETNKVIPCTINNVRNPARAVSFSTLLAQIPGEKFLISPDAYQGNEPEVREDLEWLYGQIGEPVFGRPSPRPASVPQWSGATIRSIRALVANMATQIRSLEGNAQSAAGAIATPEGLEWLNDPQPGGLAGEVVNLPSFDQATLRSLGSFIHSLARALQLLQSERHGARLPRQRGRARRA